MVFMAIFRRMLLLLAVGACAAIVAGCGSSSGSGSDTTSAPAAASTASTTKAAPKPTAKPTRVALTIKNFEYSSKSVTVAKGSTVAWKNLDVANHTVTFDSGAKRDLGSQSKGATKSMRFAKAGTFAYHCDFHPNMHGTVIVR